MLWLKFSLRDADRGRRRFRSREWSAAAFWKSWWRRCASECRLGEQYWSQEFSRWFEYGHTKNCPRQTRYLGYVAKGWWHLWTFRDEFWRWETRLVFALGGEDNMVQIAVQLPILGLVAAGVRVPRLWTSRWVYQRREFGFRLDGLWPTLLIGYDDDAHEMADYYRRSKPSCETCRRPSYCHRGEPDYFVDNTNPADDCPGYTPGWRPPRAAIWPGWKLAVPAWRWGRLKNRLLGGYENVEAVLKVYKPVSVTLPEGDYPGKVTFYRSTLKRARWPRARRDDVYGKFETDLWMPWPGKGENSYDCGDDGTQEHTETIGAGSMAAHEIDGQDVAKVIAGTVAAVLRMRARYGRFDWQPEGIGVLRD